MRVSFLVGAYPHINHPYAGIFYKKQIDALCRQGVQIEVIAPTPWFPKWCKSLLLNNRQPVEVPRQVIDDGVIIHRPRYLHWPKGVDSGFTHIFVREAAKRDLRDKPDIIHGHAAYPYGLAAVQLARYWKIPCVLTLRGSDINVLPNVNSKLRRHICNAVHHADVVLAVSDALAERTKILSGRTPRVLRNGTTLSSFRHLPSKMESRRLLELPLERNIILFVGNLLPAKGVLDLADALMLLNDLDPLGLFVGDGPCNSALWGRANVRLEGRKPNEEIPLYLRAADLLVLPSYSEGLPNVIVEAGAAQLPVVASDVGGIPEIVGNERGFLCKPGDVQDIANSIHIVLTKGDLAQQRAYELQNHVQKEYDVDKNATHLIRIYQDLL